MRLNLLTKIVVIFAAFFLYMANCHAASYIKLDGIDGESKDSNHEKWIDVLSVSSNSGKLVVIKRNGKKKWLKKTGTYRFDDGRIYIVKKGKIVKQKKGKKRQNIKAKSKAKKDKAIKGKKIRQK